MSSPPRPRAQVRWGWFVTAGVALSLVVTTLVLWSMIRDEAEVAVLNGDFEQGTLYWTTNDPLAINLTTAEDPQAAGAVAELTATRELEEMALEHRVRSVPRAEDGRTYVVSVNVKPSARSSVSMIVEESSESQSGRMVREWNLPGGEWSSLDLEVDPKIDDASLTVSVSASAVAAGETLRVDDVVVSGPADATQQGCGASDRGLPECGAYLGATVGPQEDLESFEQAVGGRLAVHRSFFVAYEVDEAIAVAQDDLAHGRLPWISFKLPHPWVDMADGEGDDWARDIAERLADLDGPVWVAFHHEPETDGDIAQWTRIQERLAPIVRETAPNVAYSIIVTAFHQTDGDPSRYGLDTIWPDTTIDLLGIDSYNYYGVPSRSNAQLADLISKHYAPIGAWARERNIPWGVAEVGYTQQTGDLDPDWLLDTYRGMQAHGGIAMAYFNSNPDSSIGNWTLDTPVRIEEFAEVLGESARLP